MNRKEVNPITIVVSRIEKSLLSKNELEDYKPSLKSFETQLKNIDIHTSFEDFTESCVELFYSQTKQGYPDELFRGSNEENTNRSLREMYRDLKAKFCEFTKKMSVPTSATIDLVIAEILFEIMKFMPGLLFITELYIVASCYYWMKVGVRNFCK